MSQYDERTAEFDSVMDEAAKICNDEHISVLAEEMKIKYREWLTRRN